ncbi:M23 family metallopeptidase [Stenotrophomonas rhizophila]|uniref:M23 family metallopeptidase n=1 Tax=Stenotrophomonas rhizophila TaxID=216778 RepID=UPI0021A37F9E|nr:M23 family metallopeptidase [Stenotrophomonas rhizophila]
MIPVLNAWADPGVNWRKGWHLDRPASASAPRDGLATDVPALAVLTLEGAGERWQARVDNRVAGPVQVELRPAAGAAALPGLPLQTVVAAGASVVVTHLQPPAGSTAIRLDLTAVPGDPAARPQDVSYQLPFDAARIQVSQAPRGRFSHNDAENREAIDFALPEGTPVLAARAGTVMQVQAGYQGNGQDRDHDLGRANLVRVLHDDGSMAVYAHLQHHGVLVLPGEQVQAGQRIGLSGNTGYSAAPHLHFAVQVNAGMRLRSIPARIVSPHGELHFARSTDEAGPSALP